MDGTQFEKELAECEKELEKLLGNSESLTETVCALLEKYDGESGEVRWSCRTMNSDIADVLSDVRRRLGRYRAGDRAEVPSALVLALDCCDRLSDTAVLFSEGKENERRDLKGQMASNLGYLAHHVGSLKEDGFVPEETDVFDGLDHLCGKIYSGTAELVELRDFVCGKLDTVAEYLTDLRENQFWEERRNR